MSKQIALIFDFRPPEWRPPGYVNARAGAVLLFSVVWLTLYVWLGVRMLAMGDPRLGWTELFLAIVCIVTGVRLILAWRGMVKRWLTRARQGRWPALELRTLYRLSPAQFEVYVAQRLFARHGYEVENTPDTRDGGVDIIVVDPNGQRAVVQCKRYRGTVGASTVRDLYGTMMHHDVSMGYLVTTGSVSCEAKEWAGGKPLALIDGDDLVRYARAEPEPATTVQSR